MIRTMKRKITFLMLILLIAGLTVCGQVEKGSLFVNGLNILSFQAGSVKSPNLSGADSKTTFTSFSIGPYSTIPSLSSAPSINYGFTNKLTGGIFLNLTSMSEKESEKYTNTGFMFGPCVRYYLADQKKCLPFVEGHLGIGSSSSKYGTADSEKSSLFGWHLGTGATYFFTPKVGADFTLGYENIVDKIKSSDQKTNYSYLQFGMGILVIF